MDVNHRERVSHNSSTNELGLWLPSGSPKDQKNNDLSRHKNGGLVFRWTGFAGKTLWVWLQLLGVLALPLVITFVALYTSELLYSRQAKIQPPPYTSTYQSDTDMLGLRDKITWDAPVVKDQSIAITISLVPIPSRSTSLQ